MIEAFEQFARYVALAAEAVATLLVSIGVVDATVRVLLGLLRNASMRELKDVWSRLAGFILLALEFALAADIVRTSIAPSWKRSGKLAAIAAIRTALSYFLERDLSSFERTPRPRAAVKREPA